MFNNHVPNHARGSQPGPIVAVAILGPLGLITCMARFLSFCLWSSAALGAVAIALISGYAAHNGSGHTGWEPFTSFILFVPLALMGAVSFALRRRFTGIVRPGVIALAMGVTGMALIIYLDRTNRLVQHDRWVQRGMP
jgi:hypothetical protein